MKKSNPERTLKETADLVGEYRENLLILEVTLVPESLQLLSENTVNGVENG